MAQLEKEPVDRLPLAQLPLSAEEVERAEQVDFEVDREGELPLGTQLDWRIRGMLIRGVLRAGDRLPSVRELAAFAGVNVNTARAVYATLEEGGLIESQQGRGTFVSAAADQLREVASIAADALAQARLGGLDSHAVAIALYTSGQEAARDESLAPFPEIDTSGDSRLARAALREQIGRLEREIAAYAWNDPTPAAPERGPTGPPPGRVADVHELERIRGELIDRLRSLRGEAAQRGRRRDALRAHAERMLDDPSAHRWETVTEGEAGERESSSWRVVPVWGPVGAIMGWWRVKASPGRP